MEAKSIMARYLLSGRGGLLLIILSKESRKVIATFRPWGWDGLARLIQALAAHVSSLGAGQKLEVHFFRQPEISEDFTCELSIPGQARYWFLVPAAGPIQEFVCEKGVLDPNEILDLLKFLVQYARELSPVDCISITVTSHPEQTVAYGK